MTTTTHGHAINVERSLTVIDAHSFSHVREKLAMGDVVPPAMIDDAVTEFKKFLSLLAMGHTGLGMISPIVDEVWHTSILFTRDYADFCNEAFGSFVHHQPGTPSQPLGSEPRARFLDAYRGAYGDLHAVWGEGAVCFSTCDTPSTNCQDATCK